MSAFPVSNSRELFDIFGKLSDDCAYVVLERVDDDDLSAISQVSLRYYNLVHQYMDQHPRRNPLMERFLNGAVLRPTFFPANLSTVAKIQNIRQMLAGGIAERDASLGIPPSNASAQSSSTAPRQLRFMDCEPVVKELVELSEECSYSSLFLHAIKTGNIEYLKKVHLEFVSPHAVRLAFQHVSQSASEEGASPLSGVLNDRAAELGLSTSLDPDSRFTLIWEKAMKAYPIIDRLAKHSVSIREAPNIQEKFRRAICFISYYKELRFMISQRLEYSMEDYLITPDADTVYRFDFASELSEPDLRKKALANIKANIGHESLSESFVKLVDQFTYSQCFLTAYLFGDIGLVKNFNPSRCAPGKIDVTICYLIANKKTEYVKRLLPFSSVYASGPVQAKFASTQLLKFAFNKQNKEVFDHLVDLGLPFDLSKEEIDEIALQLK